MCMQHVYTTSQVTEVQALGITREGNLYPEGHVANFFTHFNKCK